jgi:hypothetical protein
LIASRDGFCNPLKPNSQDYTNLLCFPFGALSGLDF